MNEKDIEVALMFMEEMEEHYTLVLQCFKKENIPYIKRYIIQKLGAPSKYFYSELWYGKRHIKIVPVTLEDRFAGLREHQVFYVSYKGEADWRTLNSEMEYRERLVPYEMPEWMSEADMVNLLVRDGMSRNEAIHKMKCDGLI